MTMSALAHELGLSVSRVSRWTRCGGGKRQGLTLDLLAASFELFGPS